MKKILYILIFSLFTSCAVSNICNNRFETIDAEVMEITSCCVVLDNYYILYNKYSREINVEVGSKYQFTINNQTIKDCTIIRRVLLQAKPI